MDHGALPVARCRLMRISLPGHAGMPRAVMFNPGWENVDVYWLSVNWKFAFGALASQRHDESLVTL